MSELLGVHLGLRRLVMFLDIYSPILMHSMLDLVIPLCGVTCVILLTMLLDHALIMHAMLNLTLYHLETMLMLS